MDFFFLSPKTCRPTVKTNEIRSAKQNKENIFLFNKSPTTKESDHSRKETEPVQTVFGPDGYKSSRLQCFLLSFVWVCYSFTH